MLYFFFFCSGLSGLIYEVIWVREFGNIFGNTVYSASLITAVFMLGLGVGGYGIGVWADRRYRSRPESLLTMYALFEAAIALLGLSVTFSFPLLAELSAIGSAYVRDVSGWYVLSTGSYIVRGAIAATLLTPITVLMGGTLTLLIRHLVRTDVEREGMRIAILYGVNTAGAALGAFLTDFALVPAAGYRGAQMTAVAVNAVAAIGAFVLARQQETVRCPRISEQPQTNATNDAPPAAIGSSVRAIVFTSLAVGLSGFAAMGMEIVWFRHFTLLLGGFRAVFSLLLAVILLGGAAGALIGSLLVRRTARPIEWLSATLGLFIVTTLVGLAAADLADLDAAVQLAVQASKGPPGAFTELTLNLMPIVIEVGLPAVLLGLAYPLANRVIQRVEHAVGRHAGVLYLSNTIGAAAGVLAGGFWLLPRFGMQTTATVLVATSAVAVIPLVLARRALPVPRPFGRSATFALGSLAAVTIVIFGLWMLLRPDHLIAHATDHSTSNATLLSLSEGISEVVAVTDVKGEGRRLLTDGHPMSATSRMSQRYMRALAHIPLLMADHPKSVLVIGFGVGNTTHATTLHPSIERVDVADLSQEVLRHAKYFEDANKSVLTDKRVTVYVNDGRQHLRMQPPATYDLITLEPPPLALSGVGALYSKEFYQLARTRLRPNGYLSQWLPAYQVSVEMVESMVRAFVDVFPQSVLLAGTDEELLLIGVSGDRLEIDPVSLDARLKANPTLREDLARLDLGTVREIVGTFVSLGRTLDRASKSAIAATDDRPLQEYGGSSRLTWTRLTGVPPALVTLDQIASWCPRCFEDGRPVPAIAGLDRYLALLGPLYKREIPPADGPSSVVDPATKGLIDKSAYLRDVLADHVLRQNARGVALATDGKVSEAIVEFRGALRLDPDSAETHWRLGLALESTGAALEAIEHLRRSVKIDPNQGPPRYDLASTLLDLHEYDEAIEEFRAAIRLLPNSAEAHNNLGIALGSQGKLEEAIGEFQQALKLGSASAQHNLTMALEMAASGTPTGRIPAESNVR